MVKKFSDFYKKIKLKGVDLLWIKKIRLQQINRLYLCRGVPSRQEVKGEALIVILSTQIPSLANSKRNPTSKL